MISLVRGVALFFCLVTAAFALNFPQLTGRVVDQAGVISNDGKTRIEAKLKDLEDKSGIQLVAPNEHKVRIEVGSGLEGTLTDALSSVVTASAIIPRFKAGDFSGGIE